MCFFTPSAPKKDMEERRRAGSKNPSDNFISVCASACHAGFSQTDAFRGRELRERVRQVAFIGLWRRERPFGKRKSGEEEGV